MKDPNASRTDGRYIFVDFRCDDCGDRYPRTSRRKACKCGCSWLVANEVWLTFDRISKLTRAERNFDARYQGGKLP